jgi:hypothetical protein
VTEPLELHDDPKLWQVYVSAGAVLDGTITADEAGRFDELLRTDVEMRRHYIQFMHDSAVFCQWSHAAVRTGDAKGVGRQPFFVFSRSAALCYAAVGLVAVLMLLGAWMWQFSAPRIAAVRDDRLAGEGKVTIFVGRVTGLLDCRWADRAAAASVGDDVPLDRKYDLAAGLMELTYHAGLRIILQGPVRFEVTSPDGGFLSAGTLTATSLRSKDENIRTMVTIRTPTVTLRDLDTQFGVAVDKAGTETFARVLRGNLRLLFPARGEVRTVAVGELGRTAFYSPGPATDGQMYTFVLRAGDCAATDLSGNVGRIRVQRTGQKVRAALARESRPSPDGFPNRAFTFDIPKHVSGHPIEN